MKEIRYFYVPQASSVNELPEEEAKHAVKVLRLQAGDTIHIVDGEGGLFEAEVTMASGDSGGGRRRHPCRQSFRP